MNVCTDCQHHLDLSLSNGKLICVNPANTDLSQIEFVAQGTTRAVPVMLLVVNTEFGCNRFTAVVAE